MCPQMRDIGRATCRRVKHARSGQQPVRHTEDALLATRRPVDELDELTRRRVHAWEMKHGGVAIWCGRDLDEGTRGVGHVDELDRDVERARPQCAPIGERSAKHARGQ